MHGHDAQPGFIGDDHNTPTRRDERSLQPGKRRGKVSLFPRLRQHLTREPERCAVEQGNLVLGQCGKRSLGSALHNAPLGSAAAPVALHALRHLLILDTGGCDIAKARMWSSQPLDQFLCENRLP